MGTARLLTSALAAQFNGGCQALTINVLQAQVRFEHALTISEMPPGAAKAQHCRHGISPGLRVDFSSDYHQRPNESGLHNLQLRLSGTAEHAAGAGGVWAGTYALPALQLVVQHTQHHRPEAGAQTALCWHSG